jgi:hypothetical protein
MIGYSPHHARILKQLERQQPALDRWHRSLPDDLRRKLSLHDFKRLRDCFEAARYDQRTASSALGPASPTGDRRP